MNTAKPLVFCLDKENSVSLKQCLNSFSARFFTDEKSLIKSVVVNTKSEFHPVALILTGDYHSVKEALINPHSCCIKSFVLCPNSSRQTFESLVSKSSEHLIGLFTTIEDLKYALEDVLTKPVAERQLIRIITDNLESYLWYDFLKQTSFKFDTVPPKQPVDVSYVNRQMESDPYLTLYTLRSSIRSLSERTCTQKKMFYGTVIKKSLIDTLTSNIDNLISFNSFVHLQGHSRTLDARHHALQCCSRRSSEVSVIFELELADQPTFKVTRIFHPSNEENLWIVQLVGTHECVKVSKQFSHTTRGELPFCRWQQPEILFGQILMAMNESDKAYAYFFEVLMSRYDQLSKIYTKVHDLWIQEQQYAEAIDQIATEFQQIKSTASLNRLTTAGKEELTYMESEFDSVWETPIALEDQKKIPDLLPPVAYRLDQVLFKESPPKVPTATTTRASSRRHCTLL